MTWAEYKELMMDEWRFCRRHPELFIVYTLAFGLPIAALIHALI